jgi:DegV family protein with EDD domain
MPHLFAVVESRFLIYTTNNIWSYSMIRLISDTLAGIPPNIAREMEIMIIPQYVVIGDRSYRDDTEISTTQLLQFMKNGNRYPQTAAPSPSHYLSIFQEYTGNGDQVLIVGPSAVLSGTINSVLSAKKEFPDKDIRIFDTGIIAAPMATMTVKAARWIKEGISLDEIMFRLEALRQNYRAYATLNTLEYLRRGGRIGGAASIVGSLLQIKPILTMGKDRIEPYSKVRTRKKAIEKLLELVIEQCPVQGETDLCVMQCEAEDEADQLASSLTKIFSINKIPIYGISSALIVHGGPGILAVSFFTKSVS